MIVPEEVNFHTVPDEADPGSNRGEVIAQGWFGESYERKPMITIGHMTYPDARTIESGDTLIIDDMRKFTVVAVDEPNPAYVALTLEPA